MNDMVFRTDWTELLIDGQLPAFTSLGLYPLVYFDGDMSTLCATCATAALEDEIPHFRPQAYGIHWEGEPIICDQCGAEIESAYGPLEEEHA